MLVKTGRTSTGDIVVRRLVFPRQKPAEAHRMDPRDTPGYRLHRALSNLNSIDTAQLDASDRERIADATMLLEQVGLFTRSDTSEETDIQVES